jgi:hypothetical protein
MQASCRGVLLVRGDEIRDRPPAQAVAFPRNQRKNQMRLPRTAIFALVATLGLAACKSELELSVFASDVQAAAEGATDRTVTAILGFEAISCETKGPLALPAIQISFPKAAFIGCRDGKMETFAEYRVHLPMGRLDPQATPPAALNVLIADVDETHLLALLFIDPAQVQAMADALPKELQYSLSGDLMPAISFRIQNDTQADWTFIVQGVFVDGNATQLSTEVALAPRDEALVRLSDVGNAAVRGNRPILFYLAKP